MATTKLSSKGRVVIPKSLRDIHRWEAGLELMVIDTGDRLLLKPKGSFAPAKLSEVAGMFKHKVTAKTDQEIETALREDVELVDDLELLELVEQREQEESVKVLVDDL